MTPASMDEMAPDEALTRLRNRIEEIDRAVVGLIAERVELARQVGPMKERAGLPTLDPTREAAVVRRAGALAREAGIDDEEMRGIFWRVIGLCRRAQARAGVGAGAPPGPQA